MPGKIGSSKPYTPSVPTSGKSKTSSSTPKQEPQKASGPDTQQVKKQVRSGKQHATGKLDDMKMQAASIQDQLQQKAGYTKPSRLPESFKDSPAFENDAQRDKLNTLMHGAEKAAEKTRGYHATRTRNLNGETGIMKEGLQPRFGGTGAAKGTKGYEDQSKGKVHYTPSKHHGEDYKQFYETGVFPWNKELTTEPSEAEVLKISLTAEQLAQATQDPHDKLGRTLDEGIDPKYIRKTSPENLPGSQNLREAQKDVNKLEEDSHGAAQTHIEKGKAENEALLSNMDEATRKTFDEMYPPGDTGSPEQEKRDTALQMLKQGLKSTPLWRDPTRNIMD